MTMHERHDGVKKATLEVKIELFLQVGLED